MSSNPNVSDTAFITCYFRSLDENLSRDPFSKEWVTPEAIRLGELFRTQVTPHDPVNIQLRCRYFVEALENYRKSQSRFTFLNLGAGFTNYPRLDCLDGITSVEVDQVHVVALKEERVGPRKGLSYLGLDFDSDSFEESIAERLNTRNDVEEPVFVLMEGFFYYLAESTSDRLWAFLLKSLPKGSRIGIIYMPPVTKTSTALLKSKEFLKSECGYDGDAIVHHKRDFFEHPSLKEVDHVDHVGLGTRYLGEHEFTEDNTFNERFLLVDLV